MPFIQLKFPDKPPFSRPDEHWNTNKILMVSRGDSNLQSTALHLVNGSREVEVCGTFVEILQRIRDALRKEGRPSSPFVNLTEEQGSGIEREVAVNMENIDHMYRDEKTTRLVAYGGSLITVLETPETILTAQSQNTLQP